MSDVFARLGTDFLSTLIFLAIYLASGNLALATSIAVAGAVAQILYARASGRRLNFMTYASLALVIVLGGATLLTDNPRFVLAKPSIAHFAIGLIMLKRDWMLRYMPPVVAQTIPQYVTVAGYALGDTDVCPWTWHHRGRTDRRHETVGDLCVRGCRRGQDRRLRRAICGVSDSRLPPPSRTQRLTGTRPAKKSQLLR